MREEKRETALAVDQGEFSVATGASSPAAQSSTTKQEDASGPTTAKTKTEQVVIIRPSFKKICGDGDACRAAIFNQMLYSIAWKVKQGVDYWYGTAEDICKAIDECWCVNKVRKEINALVEAGLLGQYRKKNWDRTLQYFFGKEQGAKLKAICKQLGICLLHLGLPTDVLHLLNMVNAIDKNGKCICQKEEMHLPEIHDASTKNGEAISKGTTKDTSKNTTEERGKREPVVSDISLSSVPPSSSSLSLLENTLKVIPDSPIKKGVLALSEKHLALYSRKETDMDKQTALAEMDRRFTSLAQLVGEEEALRQCEIALLYLKHVDKFWREHQQFLTLIKAEKNIDEALSKSKDWTPPKDAPRLYPDPVASTASIPAAVSTTQEFNVSEFEGMTEADASILATRIAAKHPGIEMCYGDLVGGGVTIEVRTGPGDDDFLSCFSPQDWYEPIGFKRRRVERAIRYWRETARNRPQLLAV